MIRFDQANGQVVMINPKQVTHVGRNHTQADMSLIYFGKDNYLSVIGDVETVGSRIGLALLNNR